MGLLVELKQLKNRLASLYDKSGMSGDSALHRSKNIYFASINTLQSRRDSESTKATQKVVAIREG